MEGALHKVGERKTRSAAAEKFSFDATALEGRGRLMAPARGSVFAGRLIDENFIKIGFRSDDWRVASRTHTTHDAVGQRQ